MASKLEKIEQILGELSDFVSGLDEDGQTGRVMGFIISGDFVNLDQPARQKKLKALLEGELSRKEMSRIGPIVTMTPDEAAIDEIAD